MIERFVLWTLKGPFNIIIRDGNHTLLTRMRDNLEEVSQLAGYVLDNNDLAPEGQFR